MSSGARAICSARPIVYVLEVRDVLTPEQQVIYDRKVREVLTASVATTP